MPHRSIVSRRRLLQLGATVPVLAAAPWPVPAAELSRTPGCADGPTPANPEGPFYTPRSPRRSSLREPGMAGVPFVVEGLVLTAGCRPVAGAVVDLWHADDRGAYDNDGYRLRGHQITDADGRFRFETIVPGRYGGRTRHYHFKVAPAGGGVLTTQLYFPGEPQNRRDPLFRPDLVMEAGEGRGRFDFVL